MRKILIIIGAILGMIFLGAVGTIAWLLYPHHNPQPLPLPLVASTSAEGVKRLVDAEAFVDYQQLSKTYQAQSIVSYCGVATSVSVLEAFGNKMSQDDFFISDTNNVRSRLSVVFGGMSLPDLAGLLTVHGLRVSLNYANQFNVDEFRNTVETNLANANDYLIVNYQREALGQGKVGHISPLAAYVRETDSVLVMDTAAHKYPPTWVPIEMLYNGMKTIDSASGKMRGYVEVSKH